VGRSFGEDKYHLFRDRIVGVDDVFERKITMLDAHKRLQRSGRVNQWRIALVKISDLNFARCACLLQYVLDRRR